jgi:hypothetical protein
MALQGSPVSVTGCGKPSGIIGDKEEKEEKGKVLFCVLVDLGRHSRDSIINIKIIKDIAKEG